jgi:hypothetical protein
MLKVGKEESINIGKGGREYWLTNNGGTCQRRRERSACAYGQGKREGSKIKERMGKTTKGPQEGREGKGRERRKEGRRERRELSCLSSFSLFGFL